MVKKFVKNARFNISSAFQGNRFVFITTLKVSLIRLTAPFLTLVIIPALMMLIACNFQAVCLQFLGNQPHINVVLTVWLDLLCRETQLQEYLQSSSPTTLSQSPLMSLLQIRLQRFKTTYLLSSQTISSFKQIILVLKVFLMSVQIHSLKHSLLTQLLNSILIIKLLILI